MLMRRESGDLLEEMYVPACELLGGSVVLLCVCYGNTAVAAFGCHGFLFSVPYWTVRITRNERSI